MLRVRIAAVGRLREKGFRESAGEYRKRLGRYCRLEVIEVDPAHRREPDRAKNEEGERLLRATACPGRRIACHEGGRILDSMAFSELLGSALTRGEPLLFLIGGTEGLSGEVLETCLDRLSLSRLTFPHELARVVLMEQIYRGFRILRGEPYHR